MNAVEINSQTYLCVEGKNDSYFYWNPVRNSIGPSSLSRCLKNDGFKPTDTMVQVLSNYIEGDLPVLGGSAHFGSSEMISGISSGYTGRCNLNFQLYFVVYAPDNQEIAGSFYIVTRTDVPIRHVIISTCDNKD
jgi:hypothetical protein